MVRFFSNGWLYCSELVVSLVDVKLCHLVTKNVTKTVQMVAVKSEQLIASDGEASQVIGTDWFSRYASSMRNQIEDGTCKFGNRAADFVTEDERRRGESASSIRRQLTTFPGRFNQLTRWGQNGHHRHAEVRRHSDAQLAAAAPLLRDGRRRSHPSHHARGRLCRVN